MSTDSRIAAAASMTVRIMRSSGPRTATTMQNSVPPSARVCRASSTSSGTDIIGSRTTSVV